MQAKDAVREAVKNFEPYSPGLSIDEIKEKYGLSQVIKMASNENPLGTSPLVIRALERKAPSAFRYPRAGNPALLAALSAEYGVPIECLAAGNGSDELIDLLLRIKARPGRDNIVAFDPCFSIYVQQSRLCGLELRQIPLEEDFSFNFEKLLAQVDENTSLVFVTNPDNPSGHAVPASELVSLAMALPEQALLVVDEAYADFCAPIDDYALLPRFAALENVVILRTFSKLFGLAGLRLGWGAMPEWLADYMLRTRLPFSVNLLAETAGLAALEDVHFRQATVETTLRGRARIAEALTGLGCRVFPSQANFLMFFPPKPAAEVFERLLEKGIIIRRLTSYKLPAALRVSIGSDEENATFIKTMNEILADANAG